LKKEGFSTNKPLVGGINVQNVSRGKQKRGGGSKWVKPEKKEELIVAKTFPTTATNLGERKNLCGGEKGINFRGRRCTRSKKIHQESSSA